LPVQREQGAVVGVTESAGQSRDIVAHSSTDLEGSQNGVAVHRNSGKESANAEPGVAVERQSRRPGYIADDLRHVGLQFRKRCNQTLHMCDLLLSTDC